jgi:hypothetical protein
VTWGNAQCQESDHRCDFELAQDESFVIDGSSVCE